METAKKKMEERVNCKWEHVRGVSLLSGTPGLSHVQPEGSCRGQEAVLSSDCLQVKQAGQVSPSWKRHVIGKGRNRMSQVRHFSWFSQQDS